MKTEEKVMAIVANVCGVDVSELTKATAIGDLPKWDSLGHINILTEISNTYSFEIEPEDIMEVENIGDIVKLIDCKTK